MNGALNGQQLFETWAPAGSVWSRWAKPVLFAGDVPALSSSAPEPEASGTPPRVDPATALVIDLPGSRSVDLGLRVAEAGYRPVPLFNGASDPGAVVPVQEIVRRLAEGAEALARGWIPDDAPPAFLLDANRMSPAQPPQPGRFDNRWMTFPQDFPSAAFLQSRGIRRVLLLQDDAQAQPRPDLAHVLLRWQEAGLELYIQDPLTDQPPRDLAVHRPSRFRGLLYRALAVVGLRRNDAGGFGSIIPTPSSGSGVG